MDRFRQDTFPVIEIAIDPDGPFRDQVHVQVFLVRGPAVRAGVEFEMEWIGVVGRGLAAHDGHQDFFRFMRLEIEFRRGIEFQVAQRN